MKGELTMDNVKIGQLICRLRKENNLTQLQLASRMNISDKTVSKWERGLGCPDISLISDLSDIFDIDLERLLNGELNENDINGGNMKKLNFYVCPSCGNIITSAAEAGISCCGKKLKALSSQKASDSERLSAEVIENDYFITSKHPMLREHYISFTALLTADTIILRRQYPEWDMQMRLPFIAHGRLFWYCTNHGLFYQDI